MSDSEASELESFVRENYQDVYRFLYSKTSSVRDAEDITQETFLRYIKGTSASERTSKGRAYLFAIARNAAIDFFRTQKPQHEILTNSLEDTLPDKSQETDDFGQLIQGLPEEMREILSLKYAQGFNTNEIADITGMSRFAVRRRIEKAFSLLKNTWKEEAL